jgi:hypothetical protein
MKRPLGLRRRQALAWLAPTIVLLSLPRDCRADLLVNDIGINNVSASAACRFPGQVAATVQFCAHGPAAETSAPAIDGAGLFALVGVCVHPPIDPPPTSSGSSSGGTTHHSGGGGGTVIGGEGGGGGVTIASTSPEPTGLLIGGVGAGLAAVAQLLRKRYANRVI